jgi:sugar phosphate isomerase/epimerase
VPIGEGGAGVARAAEALRAVKYRGWYTIEQETRLASRDERPLGKISRSLQFVLPLLT